MSLNYDVGSDSQGRYLPSKYFNPQLITWWVQWVEVCGGWGAGWGGLPRWPGTFFLSVTRPFFQRGLWEESNGATSGVSLWMAGGIDSGPAERPRGCVHVAPTSMLVLQIHLNSYEWMAVINRRYDSICPLSKCEIWAINEHCECASLSSSA